MAQSFNYPGGKPAPSAPSSENNKPVKTANQGMKPTAKPKGWGK